MATVSEILTKAADLLEKPGAWTQGAYARDVFGVDVGPEWNSGAVCFCVLGAINEARGTPHDAAVMGGLSYAVRKVNGGYPISEWNDAPGRTQAEVVAALRQAAEQACPLTHPWMTDAERAASEGA